MMAPFPTELILPTACLGEHPLPAPVGCGVGILSLQSIRQRDLTPPVFQVRDVQGPHRFEVLLQLLLQRRRQDGPAVLPALAVADNHRTSGEVEVLHAQLQALHEPNSGSIENPADEPVFAHEATEHVLHLVTRQDCGKPWWSFGADNLAKAVNIALEQDLK